MTPLLTWDRARNGVFGVAMAYPERALRTRSDSTNGGIIIGSGIGESVVNSILNWLQAQRHSTMVNPGDSERAAQLVSILRDRSARDDELYDAAMDLEFYSGNLVESALAEIIRQENFEGVLADICAESLAGIWAREDRLDEDFFNELENGALDQALAILRTRAPHLVPS